MSDDEAGEEGDFGEEVGGGAESAEFFFFVDGAFTGDFPGGVVRAHEGEEDDLEHDDAGDGGADFGLVGSNGLLFFDFLEDVVLAGIGEAADVAVGFTAEERYEDGEADEDGELEKDLAAIAEEDAPAAGEEGGELGEEAGEAVFFGVVFRGLIGVIEVERLGFFNDELAGGDELLAFFIEHGVV